MLKTFTLLCSFSLFAAISHGQIVITAVFDADLSGGLPKGVELYTLEDIPDLSIYALGSANNGQGTNGEELFLEGSATKGQFIYVSSDSASFNEFFGFDSDFQGDAMLINGDDAVELFMNGAVVDVFGQIDVDGSGTAWEYTDGWAARKSGTGPDGAAFNVQNWEFSGPGGLDGETSNATAAAPVPIMVYSEMGGGGGPDATVLAMNLQFIPRDITIEIGQTVRWTNPETNVAHNVNGNQDAFPCNPVGFFSGAATVGEWDFDFTFNQAGFYEYQCDPHISSDMFGSVTVVDPDAVIPPVYDIALVTTVDADGVADSVETVCTVEGVVHGANARPGGLQFTIIDDNGNGIGVFKSGSDCYEVTQGDRIRVTGEITQFNGLTQIEPSEVIEIVSTGNALADRISVGGTPLSEEHESAYLSLLGVQVEVIDATGASGWNVTVSDGVQTYVVRVDSDLFTDVPFGLGLMYQVNGIGGQFDSDLPYDEGYQLIPQFAEDVIPTSSVETLDKDAFALYPNPARNYIELRGDHTVGSLVIKDALGRNVVRLAGDYRIDVSGLSAGMYMIEARTDDGIWTSQFIKQD